MEMGEPARQPVEILVTDWLLIDAVVDNEVSVEAVDGDSRGVVALGSAVREAGWDALPDWPVDPAGFADWPQPGRRVTIALTDPQWSLVVDALERWAAVGAQRADVGRAEESMRFRAIAERLRRDLDMSG
ncbi:hypothetical protein [Nonomuraea sp. SBT364]|uniref:hypothetical protein n=1 Tax=Nonomuraea sp. SBT364 TaxID=1580530 RepID=UPI00066E3489|nr:hypothetical protein [Nonomuraea sp. SBT364]